MRALSVLDRLLTKLGNGGPLQGLAGPALPLPEQDELSQASAALPDDVEGLPHPVVQLQRLQLGYGLQEGGPGTSIETSVGGKELDRLNVGN